DRTYSADHLATEPDARRVCRGRVAATQRHRKSRLSRSSRGSDTQGVRASKPRKGPGAAAGAFLLWAPESASHFQAREGPASRGALAGEARELLRVQATVRFCAGGGGPCPSPPAGEPGWRLRREVYCLKRYADLEPP